MTDDPVQLPAPPPLPWRYDFGDEQFVCVHPRCAEKPVGTYVYRGEGLGQRTGWRLDRYCAGHAEGALAVIAEWMDPLSPPAWVTGDVNQALDLVQARTRPEHDYFVSVSRLYEEPSH